MYLLFVPYIYYKSHAILTIFAFPYVIFFRKNRKQFKNFTNERPKLVMNEWMLRWSPTHLTVIFKNNFSKRYEIEKNVTGSVLQWTKLISTIVYNRFIENNVNETQTLYYKQIKILIQFHISYDNYSLFLRRISFAIITVCILYIYQLAFACDFICNSEDGIKISSVLHINVSRWSIHEAIILLSISWLHNSVLKHLSSTLVNYNLYHQPVW